MIKEKTVFILGAGASAPYGLPTGLELRRRIIDLVGNEDYQGLFAQCGIDVSQLRIFTDAFYRSGTNSIDAFLEYRPEFLIIGKIAISIVIIGTEKEKNLYVGDWYQYVFEKMSTAFEDFTKNQLSILTFNYDRSLENFLFTALKNLYGKSDSDCKLAVESVPIVHLHGKIGSLPWQGGDRPYEAFQLDDLNRNVNARMWLQEGIEGIKIIHEGTVKPSEEYDNAYEILNQAKKVYFLGFGYHPLNVQRLRINTFTNWNFDVATGTAYHLTRNERMQIQSELLKNIFDLNYPNIEQLRIYDFLREYVTLR